MYGKHSAQILNSLASDLNDDAALTEVNFWDPSTLEQSFKAGYVADSTGVAVPEAGDYFVSGNVFYTSTVLRVNVGFKISVNGAAVGTLYAPGYVRVSNGHNESSVPVSAFRLAGLADGSVISLMRTQLAAPGVGAVVSQAGEAHLAIWKA